jgi:hypothetical protein
MKVRFLTFLLGVGMVAALPFTAGATSQLGIVGNASVGPTSINFGVFPTGTPYAPVGGYGTFEVNLVNPGGVFANNGVTTGEMGMIQSISGPPLAVPSTPFMTFNGPGGATLQLFATSSSNLVVSQLGPNVHAEIDIDGNLKGDLTNPGATESFTGIFSANFANTTVAALESSLPVTSPFGATFDVTITPTVPEPATFLMMGVGLIGAGLVARKKLRG